MRSKPFAVARCSLALAVAMAASFASADEPGSTPASVAPEAGTTTSNHPVGSATHTWLSVQSSNASAAPARPGGGEEASLVYHRYLDSFKHPIPTFFTSSTGKPSGVSSGTSN